MEVVITVYGLPSTYFISPADLDKFAEELRKAALVSLPSIVDQVSVLFPSDRRKIPSVEKLIIFVGGLPEKLGEEEEFRNHLARILGEVAVGRFPKASVKCFVRSPEPKIGFWEQAKGIDTKEFEEN